MENKAEPTSALYDICFKFPDHFNFPENKFTKRVKFGVITYGELVFKFRLW